MTARTFQISRLDGTDKQTVTVAEYRAALDARKPYAAAIMAAVRRGDMVAAAKAQSPMAAFVQTQQIKH